MNGHATAQSPAKEFLTLSDIERALDELEAGLMILADTDHSLLQAWLGLTIGAANLPAEQPAVASPMPTPVPVGRIEHIVLRLRTIWSMVAAENDQLRSLVVQIESRS